MRKFGYALAALAALAAGPVMAQEEALSSELTAYKVIIDPAGEEIFEPTETALPGDLIEYRIAYENLTEEALSGLEVRIPVPVSTDYIAGSAQASIPALFEASIDSGAAYSAEPVIKIVNGEEVEAEPEEYTNLRWTPAQALGAGEEFTFSYRVAVE